MQRLRPRRRRRRRARRAGLRAAGQGGQHHAAADRSVTAPVERSGNGAALDSRHSGAHVECLPRHHRLRAAVRLQPRLLLRGAPNRPGRGRDAASFGDRVLLPDQRRQRLRREPDRSRQRAERHLRRSGLRFVRQRRRWRQRPRRRGQLSCQPQPWQGRSRPRFRRRRLRQLRGRAQRESAGRGRRRVRRCVRRLHGPRRGRFRGSRVRQHGMSGRQLSGRVQPGPGRRRR